MSDSAQAPVFAGRGVLTLTTHRMLWKGAGAAAALELADVVDCASGPAEVFGGQASLAVRLPRCPGT